MAYGAADEYSMPISWKPSVTPDLLVYSSALHIFTMDIDRREQLTHNPIFFEVVFRTELRRVLCCCRITSPLSTVVE